MKYNIRYTSEYIQKLQINQHSLLTRKVFSRHNLSSQVFFSVSSGLSSSHLHLQVIFIFKSSSPSSHLHCQVIFIFKSSSSSLDHHLIWIITGSSLSLDHHWIIIIITASTISIKWCYLFILLVTGSSTEPALFHAGCRLSLLVGLLQRLYLTRSQNGQHSHLTMRGKHPTSC